MKRKIIIHKCLMYFGLVLIFATGFTKIAYSFEPSNNAYVEPEIYNALKNESYARVLIFLREPPQMKFHSNTEPNKLPSIYGQRNNSIRIIRNNVLNRLGKEDFILTHKYSLLYAFAGKISLNGLSKISNNSYVSAIILSRNFHVRRESANKVINSNIANSLSIKNLNIKGKDEVICVIDTGIYKFHPELNNKVLNEHCRCTFNDTLCCPGKYTENENDNATDDNGHGTFVAGIISGTNGVAPESKLLIFKATNYDGYGDTRDLVFGLNWCLSQKINYPNLSVISMSETIPIQIRNETVCDGITLAAKVNEAAESGIFVAVASGNDGNSDGIDNPSCASKAVSVGATSNTDIVASYSNSGLLLDLLAPGMDITSTTPPDAYCELGNNEKKICGASGYKRDLIGGTSWATPFVSGSAALIKQFVKISDGSDITPTEIKNILSATGVPILDPRNNLTFPRIDVMAAIDYLTTINVGDSVGERNIRQSQNWSTKINVTKLDNKILNVDLKWDSDDKLDLNLKSPFGQKYSNTINSSHPQHISIHNPAEGIWTVRVLGKSVKGFSNFVLSSSKQPIPNSLPGGINFTSTRLNYISACNNSNGGLQVVLKGESNGMDPTIDISDKTNLTSKAFLTGLVLQNHRMLVNLPLGKVDVDDYLKHTEAGKIMIDADVKTKFSVHNREKIKEEFKSIISDWFSILEQSPYLNELKRSDYYGFPSWEWRTWISPGSLKAEGEGCKIFLTNASLKLHWSLDWISSNIESHNVRKEVKDDVNTRFNAWKPEFIEWLSNNAKIGETEINNDPQYADLRYVYASVALAQWYKTLDRSRILFGDVIDSNDIYRYGLNTSFDEQYWRKQTNQRITENLYFNHCFANKLATCYTYFTGGVVYTSLSADIASVLSDETKNAMAGATDSLFAQKQDEKNLVYYSNLIEIKKPDLEPVDLWFSDNRPHSDKSVNVSIAIENRGNMDANDFSVGFYDNYTNSDGDSKISPIGTARGLVAKAGEMIEINVQWDKAGLGRHEIVAEADYDYKIPERSEFNNVLRKQVSRSNPYPNATVSSPPANLVATFTDKINFSGFGYDLQDGMLEGASLSWTSSIDGYLGSGAYFTTNLSPGRHLITMTAADSEGYKSKDSIALGILPSRPPVAGLISPVSRKFAEGEWIYFEARGQDEEDGESLQYFWNSSLDGLLGTSKSFSISNLSVGMHGIMLGVTDSASITSYVMFNLSIEEGTPQIRISSPGENEQIIHKSVSLISGYAYDTQEGNISSKIIWTSGIDGNIGVGSSLSHKLSLGSHLITAAVMDVHGNMATDQIEAIVKPPQYPAVSIISPRNKESVMHGQNLTFAGRYRDFEDAKIADSSLVWKSDLDGSIGSGTSFLREEMTAGNHTVYFTATDTDNMSSTASVNITINPAPPVPIIGNPSDRAIFAQIETIFLNGSAFDYEDGFLPADSLIWKSGKNGFLGSGKFLNVTNLSPGTHLITLTANDSGGLKGEHSVNVIIVGKSSILVSRFADGYLTKNLEFVTKENRTARIPVPRSANVSYSSVSLRGYSP